MANLTTLFGSPADCECKDCKNIFSPESYLVDIMQFLDNCPNGTDGRSVLQVLFDRRPDIGNLLLTCENTNTEIPYIDLVNEIMEYYVAYSIHTNTNTANQNIATLIVADGTPVITGNVTNSNNQMSLSVSSSKIVSVNFKIGDAILIDGMQYTINSNPANLNTATITFNLDKTFAGLTNATLPASSIRFYYPTGDTGKASPEELKAEPQYILMDAYKQVYQKVYPFNLPYHQPLDVIRRYLQFLKTSRAELMEVFQFYPDKSTPPKPVAIPGAAIDAERMQLSLNEYQILTNNFNDFSGHAIPGVAARPVSDYYGSIDFSGKGIPLSSNSVAGNPGILAVTGLQYVDLLAILETKFINPGQNAYNVLQKLIANTSGISANDLYKALQADYQSLVTNINNPLSTITNTLLTTAGITNSGDQNNFKIWLTKNFTAFQQVITLYQSDSACDLDNTLLHSIQWLYEQGVTSGFTPVTIHKIQDIQGGFDDAGSDANIKSDLISDFLPKLHRFVRLWRKTGWTIHELDQMIHALNETDISTTLISKLGVVNKINAVLRLPLLQLASLWSDMDTYGDNSVNFPGNISLYAQLFLRSTGNVTSNGTPRKSSFLPNPLNEILLSTETLSNHLPEIFAALSISADDYEAIIKDASLPDSISVANLSVLYRYQLLADTLGLSVPDFCTLKSPGCFNIDPFKSPDTTLDFIEKIHKFQDAQADQSNLTVPLLNYILSGYAKPIDNISLSEETILKVIPGLRPTLVKVDNDNPQSDLSTITPALLTSKLMLLYSKDVAGQFVLMLQSSAVNASSVAICGGSVPDNKIAIPAALSTKYFYSQDKNTNKWLLQCYGIMSDSEYLAFDSSFAPIQSAIDYIYRYSYTFLKNTFTGLYNSEADIDTALLSLFGLSKINPTFAPPPGTTVITDLTGKLKYFYNTFLPYLINQLKQSQVIDSIAQLIHLDAQYVSSLINPDVTGLIKAISKTGLDGYYYIGAAFGTSTPPPDSIDEEINFSWGDTAPNTKVSADNFSVRWRGWLCPPADGDYTFTIQVTEPDETAHLSIDGVAIININNPADNVISKQGTLSMSGGKLYPVIIEYIEVQKNAGIQLFWQSSEISQAVVDTQFLYPDSDIQLLFTKIVHCHQAAQAITGFGLSVKEINYIISNASDFGNINFLKLTSSDWLRLIDYNTLKKTIPANLLLPIFQQASVEDKASAGLPPSDDLITNIANASRPTWNKDYLSYLAGNSSSNPPVNAGYFGYRASAFKNEIALLAIKKAIDLAIKTQMPVSDSGLPTWTVLENDLESVDAMHVFAEQIKNAVKGKYNNNWLTIATQLNNKIRENQKQALISYMLTLQLSAPDGSGRVIDADGLFEYLLIDVQMTPVVVTSRIIQATLAVQLFADRCLLGLETGVPLTSNAVNPDEWEWMKHYSVYAGLKKLFVYVENYLDPSLRDDKSSFFLDFESAIKKNDITDENVENAFRDYLNKLNEVSNMELCGMYHDTDTQTLYVFARTHAAPYNYYFRQATNTSAYDGFVWSPWERLQLDIKSVDDGNNSGVHLMPVFWKKRLFLFWPEFIEKSIPPAYRKDDGSAASFRDISDKPVNSQTPQKYSEIRLAWSEYAHGKWAPKKLSKEIISTNPLLDPSIGWIYTYNYNFHSSIDPSTEILTLTLSDHEYVVENYNSNPTLYSRKIGQFILTDIHEPLSAQSISYPAFLSDMITATSSYHMFFQSFRTEGDFLLSGTDFLRKTGITHKLLFSNNVTLDRFVKDIPSTFFYTDYENNRTYFATPSGSFGYLANPNTYQILSNFSVFNVEFYLNHYSDLQASFGNDFVAAINHWLSQGLPNEGRRGSLEFDVQFYLGSYPDLQAAFGSDYTSALEHWVTQGLHGEGRRGSLEFDAAFYLNHYPDLLAAFGIDYTTALEHWISRGLSYEGRRGCREFDVQYYLATYPDIKTAFGNNYTVVINHWLNQGLSNEGRRGCREFDVQYYLATYPDLQAAFGNNFTSAINHWLWQGLPVEGRRGSLDFDVRYYLSSYPDIQTAFGTNYTAALDHWLNYGIAEGRKGAP